MYQSFNGLKFYDLGHGSSEDIPDKPKMGLVSLERQRAYSVRKYLNGSASWIPLKKRHKKLSVFAKG